MTYEKREMTDEEREAFAEKVRSLQFRPSGRPSLDKDRAVGRDMEAYKRMRNAGLQPTNVLGAADVEAKAQSKVEVETGIIMSSDTSRELAADIVGGDSS